MYMALYRDVSAKAFVQGSLTVGPSTFASLELPWLPDAVGKGGHPDASCVPSGLYKLVRHDSPKHPKSFALVNPDLDVYHADVDVPPGKKSFARTEVLLHIANYPYDLEGCIGVGTTRGDGCINDSRNAMTKFNQLVPWEDGHYLGINWAPGLPL